MYYIITIATYNLQHLTVDTLLESGQVNVTCVFAIGSHATGCMVEFTDIEDSNNNRVIITRADNCQSCSTVVDYIETGLYNITVYEIVNNTYTIVEHLAIKSYSIVMPNPHLSTFVVQSAITTTLGT